MQSQFAKFPIANIARSSETVAAKVAEKVLAKFCEIPGREKNLPEERAAKSRYPIARGHSAT